MFAEINHNSRAHRFETKVDGVPCVLDYTLEGDVMTITHTIVPSAVGGRGIASNLVRTALDTARVEHWKVDPALFVLGDMDDTPSGVPGSARLSGKTCGYKNALNRL